MAYSNRPLVWTVFCLAFVAVNYFLIHDYVFPALNTTDEIPLLIAEKGIVALGLFFLLSLTKGWRAAGFRPPKNWGWLPMGGTIWIGILSAVPGGFQYLMGEPGLAAAYGLIGLLVAFGEEGVFRGVMLHAQERWSLWSAALISSFFFGAMHLLALTHAPGNPFFVGQAGAAMAIGLLMAGLTLRYRSIYPAVFFHFLLDAVQFWNAGGVRNAVDAQSSLSSLQLTAGIIVAIILFGGWGAFLVAMERRTRRRETRTYSHQ